MKKRKIGFFALLICLLLSLPVSAAETKKEGWQKASDGVAYYYKNGKIAKGFVRIKNKTCYFNQRGKLVKDSWVFYKGKKYRADHWGTIKKNCFVCVDGKFYSLKADGSARKGWQQFPYGLAYFGNDGALRKGLQTINGKAYLFSQKGILLTGTQTVGKTTYYLSDRGRLEMKKVSTGNGTLYYDGNGKKLSNVKVQDIETLERAKKIRYIAAAAGVALLLFNLVFGTEKFGAKNWMQLGGISFQPSELVKICFVFAGASTLQRLMAKRNLILFIGYSAAICGCLALMNDFGTAIIFFITFLIIAFLRSGNFATIARACAGTGFAGVLALHFKPYAMKRFSVWGHVWENASSTGYSQTRALMCIASGGLFGLGAGKGWLHHVGAADTDLVFALVSEEWGLLLAGLCVAAIVLLAAFVVRSLPQGRSCFYAIGAASAVTIYVVQAMLNVFGTTDLLPLTGVTFPFVSNGGSSMICVWGLLAFIKAADTRQNATFAIRLPKRKEAAV